MLVRIPSPPGRRLVAEAIDISGAEGYFVGGIVTSSGLSAYEPEVFSMLCALLEEAPKPARLLDIGSNIGMYSLVMKAIFGRDVEVHAFEPAPDLASIIRAAGRRNSLDIVVHQSAISDTSGVAEFYLSSQSDTSSSLNPRFRPHKSVIRVETRTLDETLDDMPVVPCVLKIDTESTEPSVLKGADRYINVHRPYVVCEVLAGRTEAELQRFADTHDYLPIQIKRDPHWEGQAVTGDRTYEHRDWLFAPMPVATGIREKFGEWMNVFSAIDPDTSTER